MPNLLAKLSFPFVKTLGRTPVRDKGERQKILTDNYAEREMQIKARMFTEFLSDFKLTKLTDYDSYMNAGLRRIWATFRSYDLIAKAVLSTDFFIEQKKKKLEVEDHPLLELLQEPNPYESWEDMVYPWVFHMGLTGNAYWLKDEINGKKQPSALYWLLPQYIEVIPDRKIKIARYDYRINGRILQFSPDEIIHFKRPHPNNIIFGIGDIEASEPLFEDFINRGQLEESYLAKGGTPSAILTKKDAVEDPDEWRAFKAKWDEEYGGKQNAGKVAFLSGDWTYTRLGMTPQEIQGIERMNLSVKQIFALHGVPLSVAGLEGSANYATAKTEEIQFKRWTVIPYLDMLVTKINSGTQLARNYDKALRLAYELGGLTDIGAIVTEYGPLIDRGAMTRNELREICGLEPVKDKPMMDEYLINSGLVPIDMAGTGSMPQPGVFDDPNDWKKEMGLDDDEEDNSFGKTDEEKDDTKQDDEKDRPKPSNKQ
jgi:HK97 family phage portal protein